MIEMPNAELQMPNCGVELFPSIEAVHSLSGQGTAATPGYDGAGAYRCTSEGDCAEQVRVLRFVEGQGLEGATLEEIEAALGLDGFEVSLFRVAAVVEWMIGRDGMLRKATASRWGVGTVVVVATYLKSTAEAGRAQRCPGGGN